MSDYPYFSESNDPSSSGLFGASELGGYSSMMIDPYHPDEDLSSSNPLPIKRSLSWLNSQADLPDNTDTALLRSSLSHSSLGHRMLSIEALSRQVHHEGDFAFFSQTTKASSPLMISTGLSTLLSSPSHPRSGEYLTSLRDPTSALYPPNASHRPPISTPYSFPSAGPAFHRSTHGETAMQLHHTADPHGPRKTSDLMSVGTISVSQLSHPDHDHRADPGEVPQRSHSPGYRSPFVSFLHPERHDDETSESRSGEHATFVSTHDEAPGLGYSYDPQSMCIHPDERSISPDTSKPETSPLGRNREGTLDLRSTSKSDSTLVMKIDSSVSDSEADRGGHGTGAISSQVVEANNASTPIEDANDMNSIEEFHPSDTKILTQSEIHQCASFWALQTIQASSEGLPVAGSATLDRVIATGASPPIECARILAPELSGDSHGDSNPELYSSCTTVSDVSADLSSTINPATSFASAADVAPLADTLVEGSTVPGSIDAAGDGFAHRNGNASILLELLVGATGRTHFDDPSEHHSRLRISPQLASRSHSGNSSAPLQPPSGHAGLYAIEPLGASAAAPQDRPCHPSAPAASLVGIPMITKPQGSTAPTGSQSSRAKRERNRTHTPRPSNSFILYRREKHAEITANFKGPKGINNNIISKIVAAMWKSETPEIKEIYAKKAEEEKKAHMLKYPDYKYRPKKSPNKNNMKAKSAGSSAGARYPHTQPLTSAPTASSSALGLGLSTKDIGMHPGCDVSGGSERGDMGMRYGPGSVTDPGRSQTAQMQMMGNFDGSRQGLVAGLASSSPAFHSGVARGAPYPMIGPHAGAQLQRGFQLSDMPKPGGVVSPSPWFHGSLEATRSPCIFPSSNMSQPSNEYAIPKPAELASPFGYPASTPRYTASVYASKYMSVDGKLHQPIMGEHPHAPTNLSSARPFMTQSGSDEERTNPPNFFNALSKGVPVSYEVSGGLPATHVPSTIQPACAGFAPKGQGHIERRYGGVARIDGSNMVSSTSSMYDLEVSGQLQLNDLSHDGSGVLRIDGIEQGSSLLSDAHRSSTEINTAGYDRPASGFLGRIASAAQPSSMGLMNMYNVEVCREMDTDEFINMDGGPEEDVCREIDFHACEETLSQYQSQLYPPQSLTMGQRHVPDPRLPHSHLFKSLPSNGSYPQVYSATHSLTQPHIQGQTPGHKQAKLQASVPSPAHRTGVSPAIGFTTTQLQSQPQSRGIAKMAPSTRPPYCSSVLPGRPVVAHPGYTGYYYESQPEVAPSALFTRGGHSASFSSSSCYLNDPPSSSMSSTSALSSSIHSHDHSHPSPLHPVSADMALAVLSESLIYPELSSPQTLEHQADDKDNVHGVGAGADPGQVGASSPKFGIASNYGKECSPWSHGSVLQI